MKERLVWPFKATGTSIRQIMKASSRGQLEHLAPRKGKNMTNVETNTTEPFVDLVEILDSDGNPTGQYRPREATQEEASIFTTAEDGDHAVTIN